MAKGNEKMLLCMSEFVQHVQGNEKMLPISVSCWPSASGSDVTVNLEYEKSGKMDVSNLRVIVPCPGEAEITDVGMGDSFRV